MASVVGLDVFREHFAEHADKYVLIGGVASLLVSDEQGVEFRATKDLDIILCVEALDDSFMNAFWDFIGQGGYAVREAGAKPRNYYRFRKPATPGYPVMLELFSRVPDGVRLEEGATLTPIPADETASSLSAILMDDDYYAWVVQGKKQVAGITLVGQEHLIPLKASAYLDLSRRKADGEAIDSKNIRKHRADVVRLVRLLTGEPVAGLPDVARSDIKRFIDEFPEDFEFRELRPLDRAAVINTLTATYLN